MDGEDKKSKEAAEQQEQLDAAKKVIKLLDVLPPQMWGKSIMAMKNEHGEGNSALEKVGFTAEDLLCLKASSFMPADTRSREGFTLRAIASPCAVFIAQMTGLEMQRAIDQVERVANLVSQRKHKS